LRQIRKTPIFSIAVLGVFLCIFFLPALKPGNIFFHLDHSFQNIPFRFYAFNSISAGRIPLWCPFSAAGFPLFAEGQSGVAYPLNWITYNVLPFSEAYKYSLLSHLLLLAAGFYLFSRKLGVTRCGALLTATGVTFSGYIIRKSMFVNMIQSLAWLPLLLWLWAGVDRERFKKYGLISGIILGFQLLAGHPQAAVLSWIVFALFVIASPSHQMFIARFTYLLLSTVLGLGISICQWLPTLRLMLQSIRHSSSGFSGMFQMSFPPSFFPALIFPDFFGNAAKATFWGNWQAYEWELSSYIGVTILLLTCAAPKNNPWSRFLLAMLFLGLFLGMGNFTPFYEVITEIPILNSFRIPSRWLIFFVLGSCLLAGRGLDALCSDDSRLRKHATKNLTFQGIPILLVIPGCYFTVRGLNLVEAGEISFGTTAETSCLRGMIFGLFLIIVLTAGRKFGKKGFLPWIILGSTFLELYFSGAAYIGAAPSDLLLKQPDILSRVNTDKKERILSLMHEPVTQWNWHAGWKNDHCGDYHILSSTLPMYSGMLYRVNLLTFDEWSPLHNDRYVIMGSKINRKLLDRLNVKYVLGPKLTLPFNLTKVYEGDSFILYENESTLPQAILTKGRACASSRHAAFLLQSPAYKPGTECFIETEKQLDIDLSQPSGSVTILGEGAHFMELSAEIESPGCVVLSKAYDQGWKALVDGGESRIYRADFLFMGVILEKGHSTLTMRYRPMEFLIGLFISLCFMSFIITCSVRGLRKAAKKETGVQKPGAFFYRISLVLIAICLISGLVFRSGMWVEAFKNWNTAVSSGDQKHVTEGQKE